MTLLAALAALLLWIVLAFVVEAASGVVHALLAIGVTFLIRWWVLQD